MLVLGWVVSPNNLREVISEVEGPMMKWVKKFFAREDGVVFTEYALLLVLVVLVAAVGVALFGGDLSSWFSNVGDNTIGNLPQGTVPSPQQ